MRRTYFALAFLYGCSVSSNPEPEPSPAPVDAGGVELPVTGTGIVGWNACDKTDVVVINGQRIRMPVMCNPEYFYGGDPPPREFMLDRAVPER